MNINQNVNLVQEDKKGFNLKVVLTIILLTTLLSMISCNKYEGIDNSKTYGNRTVHGDPEPVLPDKKENDKTLKGIDSDNDGVRDDIEIYINENVKDYNLNNAMKQYAKVMGRVFNVYNDGFFSINRGYIQEYYKTGSCISFLSRDIKRGKEVISFKSKINEYNYDTSLRKKAKKTMRKSMDGNVINVLNENKPWYTYCKFKIKDKEKMIVQNKKLAEKDQIESDRVYKEMRAFEEKKKKNKK